MRSYFAILIIASLPSLGHGEPSAADARPMPNRFLFTCLGWPTAQADQDYYPAEIPDQLVDRGHRAIPILQGNIIEIRGNL